MTRLREVWDRGGASVGGWCVIPSPFSAELMGLSGFDWVCLDMQHGLIGYDALVPMLQALSRTGTPSFVRVPWNQPDHIMKALDAGAQGVVVPMVNSTADAEAATGACRYPPRGYRSWGPVRAALELNGFNPETANREVVCVVMVETAAALADLDSILSVPGIDGVYVGPNDMAVTHGLPPDANATRPEHRRLISSVREACDRHGIVAGIHCGTWETAAGWREEGFRMLNVASDAVFLRGAAAEVVKSLTGEPAPKPTTSSYA
ncbi:MAG: 2,4-dihydroxyhept-2-ene-1,7-dioic acid aldolase [Chloroflexi bacterium]|nr:MAG: 2,4-dihydroxyhept-2-ene-1,7-dioic acid aldolase [Chloroflexota bacterium]